MGLELLRVRLLQKGEWGGSGAGVGRGFSGNEQLGVLCPPFDGCVFTFFCYLVSMAGIDDIFGPVIPGLW